MKKLKNQRRQYTEENAIEAKSNSLDSSSGAIPEITSDFWEQVLGVGNQEEKQPFRLSGDLEENKELTLRKPKEKEKNIEAGIEYGREVLHGEQRISHERNQDIARKIEEILIELKQLIHSSQELKVEFKEIAIQPRIANPGKYHVSFLEWMLLIIKGARMKIEDSNVWLSVFKSKKAKKEYWAMFKKQGTSFGLSNERNVATQVG